MTSLPVAFSMSMFVRLVPRHLCQLFLCLLYPIEGPSSEEPLTLLHIRGHIMQTGCEIYIQSAMVGSV